MRHFVRAADNLDALLCEALAAPAVTDEEVARCHDCGVVEGVLHVPGCDMERCPFCGAQLISCACAYAMLGLRDPSRFGTETDHLSPEIYEHGLTDEQSARWDAALRAKGLIPYIRYPNLCAKCGALWPDLFHVPDEEWARYIEPAIRSEAICRPCYDGIVALVRAAEARARAAKEGRTACT